MMGNAGIAIAGDKNVDHWRLVTVCGHLHTSDKLRTFRGRKGCSTAMRVD
jgi:hypothetical protein